MRTLLRFGFQLSFSLALASAAVGCSSSDSPAAKTDTGAADVDGPKLPAESCVRPGDKGNDKGVGTPCTPLGKECVPFAEAPVCLADVGQNQWMCTRVGCSTDDQCGKDATCFKDPAGSGCVPNRCLAKGDAGADATDADAKGDGAAGADTGDASSDAAGG